MFSKKKVGPVVQRSRFAKAKPKIVPKSSQPKNEKALSKSSGEEIGSEPLSPVTSKKVVPDASVVPESVPLNPEQRGPSNKSVGEVSPNRGNSSKASTDESEQGKHSLTENEHENLDKNSSLQNESEIPVNSVCQDSKLPVTCASLVSVACTETPPVKTSSLKEVNKSVEDEPSYFLPNNEQPTKTSGVGEKVMIHPSPIKTSVLPSTDRSLKHPCLAKILAAAPKKRPHNKEMNERKKKMASYKELPPRNEMTFTDLIYWNPNTAPMKKKEKSLTVFDPIEQQTTAEEEEDELDEGDDDDDTSIAPKLFVNENGEIIVDETSLVRERKKTFVDMNSEAVILDDSDVTYATFRRKVSKKWSPKETVNFYKALSVIGTDFALMESIIPNRTRRELKIKFKKEEKINMELLHRAMYETDTFQSELSVEGLDLEVIEIPGLEESVANNAEASNGGKKSKKRKSQVLSEIASNDGSNENDSQPVKKGRGRPKGKKNANTSHAENSSPPEIDNDCSVDSSPLVRIKRVTTLPRDSIESSDNVMIEEDEASLILRKKKTRILSQSSQEDEYCEIQVQINSLAENEDSYNPKDKSIPNLQSSSNFEKDTEDNICTEESVDENICLEPSINPEESPTENAGSATSSYVRLQKLPIPEEMIISACKSSHNSNSQCESGMTGHGPLEILSIKKEKLVSPSVSMKNEFLSPANKQTKKPATPEPRISESSDNPVNPKATLQRGRKLNIKPNVKLQKNKNVNLESTTLSSCNNSSDIESMCNFISAVGGPIDILSVKKEKLRSPLKSEPLTTINKQSEKTVLSEPLISESPSDSSTKGTYRRGRKLNVKPNVKFPKCKSADPQPVKIEEVVVQTDYVDPESLAVINILDDQVLSEGATDVVTTPAVSKRQKTKGTHKGLPDNNQKRSLPSSFSYTPVMEPETEQLPADPPCTRETTSRVRQLRQQTYPRTQSDKPHTNVGSPSYNNHSTMPSADCASTARSSSSPLVTTLNTSSNRILSIPMTPEMAGGNETVMLVNPSPNGKSFHFFVPNFVGSTPLPSEISAPPSRIRRPGSFSLAE